MSDTGWKSPTNTGSIISEWENPTNVYVDDSNYATAYISGHATYGTDQDYSSFNFNIPSGTINGIEVLIKGYVDGIAPETISVSLSYDGGINWTASKTTPSFDPWTLETFTLGGNSDLWGRTSWTASELNNTNFYAKFSANILDWTIWVYSIQIKVYYTDNSTPVIGAKYPLPPFRRS